MKDRIDLETFGLTPEQKRPYEERASFLSTEYVQLIMFQNEFVQPVKELKARLTLRRVLDYQDISVDIAVSQPLDLSGHTHNEQAKLVMSSLIELNEKLLQALRDNNVRSPFKYINRMFKPAFEYSNTVVFKFLKKH